MKFPDYLDQEEAKEQGFIIDSHASGRPIAYKGARFQPTELKPCFTKLESNLIRRIRIYEMRMKLAKDNLCEFETPAEDQ